MKHGFVLRVVTRESGLSCLYKYYPSLDLDLVQICERGTDHKSDLNAECVI